MKISRFLAKANEWRKSDIHVLYHSSSAMSFANDLTFTGWEVSLINFSVKVASLFYFSSAILFLYLTKKLSYDDDTATVIFHASAMSLYLCSLFGAIIADSWWGKFKTIFWLSLVYAIGSTIVAVGSFEPWKLPAKDFTIIGLVLISIGSGGIKPCVAVFGGEQFKLPEQVNQLLKFFSIFYFSINFGSVLTTIITPLLTNLHCFGMSKCFVAGFGLPAVLMFLSIIIFTSGYKMYKIIPPQGNILVKVIKCISVSVARCLTKNALNFFYFA